MAKPIRPVGDRTTAFRLSEEELEILKQAAVREERTLSAFIRFWTLSRAREALGITSSSSNTTQQAA